MAARHRHRTGVKAGPAPIGGGCPGRRGVWGGASRGSQPARHTPKMRFSRASGCNPPKAQRQPTRAIVTTTAMPYIHRTYCNKITTKQMLPDSSSALIRHDVFPSFRASPADICLRPLGSCLLPHLPANRAFPRVSHYLFQPQFLSIHHLVARILVRPVHSCPSAWPAPTGNLASHLVRLHFCPT